MPENTIDVQLGQLVTLRGEVVYVADVRENDQGEVVEVMIRKPAPGGKGWRTNWMSAATFRKRFDGLIGVVDVCGECMTAPAYVSLFEPGCDLNVAFCQCSHCGLTWFEPLNEYEEQPLTVTSEP